MSEYLHKVLEFVETLSTGQRINDGEYLATMNCLKQINDALKLNKDDTIYEDEEDGRHRFNIQQTRFATYARMRAKYIRADAEPHLTSIVDWASEFETIITHLENNTNPADGVRNTYTLGGINLYAIVKYLPHIKEEYVNLILFSNHIISKYYKRYILTHNLNWKRRIVFKCQELVKLSKEDLKDKKKYKSHIIKVDISKPFTETFCMPTRYIRLGKENNTLSVELNEYVVGKMIEANKLDSKYIKLICPNDAGYITSYFNLEVSGIDAKTRNQKRQYSYELPDVKYNITYLTK